MVVDVVAVVVELVVAGENENLPSAKRELQQVNNHTKQMPVILEKGVPLKGPYLNSRVLPIERKPEGYWTTGTTIFLLISIVWGYISPPASCAITGLVGKALNRELPRKGTHLNRALFN